MKEKLGGTPFDHRPDPLVGEALRRLLTTTDDGAFAARVLAAAARPVARTSVDILAHWARPGIAAAVVAAMIGGLALARQLVAQPDALDDAMATSLSTTPATAALASSEGPPDGSVAFATFIEP
jgi:hypothetical protein